MNVGYSAKEVVRITGVKYRTLDFWAKSGVVEPTIAKATGTGTDRIYSFRDMVALRVARELRESGISTQALRKVVTFLREEEGLENPLADARLVVVGRDVMMVTSDAELISVLQAPGQTCLAFVLDLARTVAELRQAAEQVRRTTAA